jgi:hypothetical protein
VRARGIDDRAGRRTIGPAALTVFRTSFACLWCGRTWRTRSASDLEGWAVLCPDCLGRAQENGFLRYRLRTALRERSRAEAGAPVDRSDEGSAR